MRKIDKLIIHCSATPEGRHVTVDDISRWHRQQGFCDVGYHYVIYLDGSVHLGRPVAQVGAHCKGVNAHSIGICYVGGLTTDGLTPKDTRTSRQRTALRALIQLLKLNFPLATVHGHREFNPQKACPCFDVGAENF